MVVVGQVAAAAGARFKGGSVVGGLACSRGMGRYVRVGPSARSGPGLMHGGWPERLLWAWTNAWGGVRALALSMNASWGVVQAVALGWGVVRAALAQGPGLKCMGRFSLWDGQSLGFSAWTGALALGHPCDHAGHQSSCMHAWGMGHAWADLNSVAPIIPAFQIPAPAPRTG